MRSRLCAFLLLVVGPGAFCGCGAPPAGKEGANPGADLARDIFGRSVRVEAYGEDGDLVAVGSGVWVEDDLVATAAHVMDAGRSWECEFSEVREGRLHIYREEGIPVGRDRARDVALFRATGSATRESRPTRIPIAAGPLVRGESVYVYSPIAAMAGRVWVGRVLDASSIDLPLAPGASGAGVFVLRDGRYELAGLVVARTTEPPKEIERRTFEGDGQRINIVLQKSSGTVTRLIPVAALHDLVKRCREEK